MRFIKANSDLGRGLFLILCATAVVGKSAHAGLCRPVQGQVSSIDGDTLVLESKTERRLHLDLAKMSPEMRQMIMKKWTPRDHRAPFELCVPLDSVAPAPR